MGFNDCHNYAIEIVKILIGKTVGWWPIENGTEFGKRIIDDLDQIANQAGPAVIFAVINPFYWLTRAIADWTLKKIIVNYKYI